MPRLIAECGRFAGVDLLPHLGRLGDPVFLAIVEAVAGAGIELQNELFEKQGGGATDG